MKTKLVRVPKEVVENKRDILNRAVMRRKRIEKQMMAKRLQNQKRALNKRIVVREILVVPDSLSLQGRRVNNNSSDCQEETAKPISFPNTSEGSFQPRRLGTAILIGPNGWD